MAPPKLKLCPFCRGATDEGVLLPSRRDWRIRCIDCDACVFGDTLEEAITKWNRRTPPPADAGREADLLANRLTDALSQLSWSCGPNRSLADAVESGAVYEALRAALAREGENDAV